MKTKYRDNCNDRRNAQPTSVTAPTPSSARVDGSGAAATTALGGDTANDEATVGAPVKEGSKTNATPAPTVKLVPVGMALEFVT